MSGSGPVGTALRLLDVSVDEDVHAAAAVLREARRTGRTVQSLVGCPVAVVPLRSGATVVSARRVRRLLRSDQPRAGSRPSPAMPVEAADSLRAAVAGVPVPGRCSDMSDSVLSEARPQCDPGGNPMTNVIDLLREGVPLRLLVDLADPALCSEALLDEDRVPGSAA